MRKVAYYLTLLLVLVANGILLELPGSFFYSIIRVVALPTTLIWLCSVVARRGMRRWHPFLLAAVLFVAWNAATLFWTVDEAETLWRLSRYAPMLLTAVIVWDVSRTRLEAEAMLQAFVLGGYVAILGVMAGYHSGDVSIAASERYSAFNFHPDDVALIVAIGVPLAWHLALTRTDHIWLLRCLNFFYPFAAAAAVLLTATRGALITLIPGFIFMLLSFPRLPRTGRQVFVGMMLAVLLALPLIAASQQGQRLASTTNAASGDKLSGRLEIWEAAIDVFSKNPIGGIGGGAFPTATASYAGLPKNEEGGGIIAHNTYLSVLAETGLIGFGLFCWMLVLVFYSGWRLPKPFRDAWITTLLAWAIGVFTLAFEFRWQTWLIFILAVTCGNYESARSASVTDYTTERERAAA